jgi:hypothetical protein
MLLRWRGLLVMLWWRGLLVLLRRRLLPGGGFMLGLLFLSLLLLFTLGIQPDGAGQQHGD